MQNMWRGETPVLAFLASHLPSMSLYSFKIDTLRCVIRIITSVSPDSEDLLDTKHLVTSRVPLPLNVQILLLPSSQLGGAVLVKIRRLTLNSCLLNLDDTVTDDRCGYCCENSGVSKSPIVPLSGEMSRTSSVCVTRVKQINWDYCGLLWVRRDLNVHSNIHYCHTGQPATAQCF